MKKPFVISSLAVDMDSDLFREFEDIFPPETIDSAK